MKYGDQYPKWDCGAKYGEDMDDCDGMDMGMDCECPPKMSCKMQKECVKTFTCQYKLYRICTYRLYKVCPRCAREYDYHGCKGMCPHCH